jgi:uncharacterized protein YyaL (SSP411 family)
MANRLINEHSPYLLQHANNPVDWYAWGDEAFEKAKNENKPVLVSIGYAACHWCHVMEHESFENEEVAKYMNEHFVNIKVDREEHPDVDHIYMDAVQAISGSGGWPLNVFVTPERVPIYGGTYYPPRPIYNRPSWLQVLERIATIWKEQPEEVHAQGNQMLQYLKQASVVGMTKNGSVWDKEKCRQVADTILKSADKEWGGFGQAPKFPGTMAIGYLLEHYQYTGYEPALKHALRSLDAMIEGGIYDQIGGGFARYATDTEWLIPHFEKMLYDNALLVSVLSDAYVVTKDENYKEVIEQTLAFAERELKDKKGGYYCALDADSEGVEGKFYVWTWDEWTNVIGEDKMLEEYFGVSEEGNWEHATILHRYTSIKQLAKKYKISETEIKERVKAASDKLFRERTKKIRPSTDDKCLLSWNALWNKAMSKAAAALQSEELKQRATIHADWMLENFSVNGSLKHAWKNGQAYITANLDDYAFLIDALLQLASATGENKRIEKALELTAVVNKEFLDEDGSFYYYTSKEKADIPVRKIETYDGATPSANATMASNLMILSMCSGDIAMQEQALYMIRSMGDTVHKYPTSFALWAQVLQRNAQQYKTLVCAGAASDMQQRKLQGYLLPEVYILRVGGEKTVLTILQDKQSKDESTSSVIFVCTADSCLPPVSTIENVLDLINYRLA